MKNQDYSSVNDFKGLALQYIKYPEEVNWNSGKIRAVTDPAKFDGCGLCTQTLCLASYLENGIAKVRREDCSGCGLFLLTCPRSARKLVLE